MRAVRLWQRSRIFSARKSSWISRNTRHGYCTVCEPASASSPTPEAETTLRKLISPKPPSPDHRQLGVEQELFMTSPYSPGSPIFLPKGARLFNKLSNFLRAQYEHFGFEEVITPTIYKKSLWEKSGHWQNYAKDMYMVTGRGATGETEGKQVGENEEYGLKPMNCPGHCLIFAAKPRSYRDLPIRYADFSPLHRNEVHGALSGLTRVRRFHQDDGHIFCRPSQIKEEILRTLYFVDLAYETLGLGPYRLALSTRPKDHFIGTVEEWDSAESALKEALDERRKRWTINEGDGAFYGPKIDIILKDSDGKEHQTATIQLDFQLPKRFELEYQAPAPELEQKGLTTDDPKALEIQGPVTPILIHRAVLGSVERTMALLIEHYNGHWPFWLNPNQMIILTVNDTERVVKFAQHYKRILQSTTVNQRNDGPAVTSLERFSIDIDDSPRSLKKKLWEAKQKRYSVIGVVGDKDIDLGLMTVDFTGMYKPNKSVARLGLLRKLVAMKEKKWQGGTSAGSADEYGLPYLNKEQMRAFQLKPGWLKTIMTGWQQSYL